MDQKTEAEIVVRVLKGDRQAYALLVEEYKNPIYNLAYRMTLNPADAEDLAQETFLRSFRELSRFDTNRSFYTWLYTISLNLIRNHLKKAGRRKTGFQNMETLPDISAKEFLLREADDQEGSSREKEKQLEICLKKLLPELRELLVLRFYQGLSFEMIADVTGISQSAVKMRVYRGLEKLRKILQKM
ncbi:MAG: sigma-70 family RNA polymerase sigma factor [Syntrophaceae bacterium]|nr:sigma-70 family RNA polymerase sigma factor [Syntrophaceae bacterium]